MANLGAEWDYFTLATVQSCVHFFFDVLKEEDAATSDGSRSRENQSSTKCFEINRRTVGCAVES